jgi:hypothetical protein
VSALSQIYACKQGDTCNAPNYELARQDMEEKLNPLPLGYKTGSVQKYWNGLLGTGRDPGSKPSFWDQIGSGLYTLGGWLLTAIAVSLGAPFWFDMLNNFVNLRINGAKPPTAVDTRAEMTKTVVDVKAG